MALVLKIVTPAGQTASVECDSIRLKIPDDEKGQQGGSVGIRKGHTATLLAVAPGTITAVTNDGEVKEFPVGGGFAFVEKDVVTVLCDKTE